MVMSRLDEIIDHKKKEIQPWIAHTEEWRQRAKQSSVFRGFKETLIRDGFGFIAEVKKASPSVGVITENFDPAAVATAYDQAAVSCISVLTDEKYFHGHLDYLALIRTRVSRPLLRKDFTIHEAQIYQASLAGADAVLLIVAALSDEDLERLYQTAGEIGIDCLVEVHNESELERALKLGATFLGINNRNLATFEVDLNTTLKLAPQVPDSCVVISESGIKTSADVRAVAQAGVDGALIGESLMRAPDPAALLQEFIRVTRP
jgi:indole-3-glycerol phosphate synthase